MTDLLVYKGYQALINFSNEDKVYFGKILDIDDLISFEGGYLRTVANSF